jgi:hypothetical protein
MKGQQSTSFSTTSPAVKPNDAVAGPSPVIIANQQGGTRRDARACPQTEKKRKEGKTTWK